MELCGSAKALPFARQLAYALHCNLWQITLNQSLFRPEIIPNQY
jgi:hypothetical protein